MKNSNFVKRFLFTIILFCSLILISNAQKHQGKCGLEIDKAVSQNVLGKNVGYYLVFKNTANSAVDAITWKAKFYNNFNEFKGERDGEWSSGNFVHPILPNETAKKVESNFIDGATKVFITIKKVHFVDDKVCK
jgi:hypothetical protein